MPPLFPEPPYQYLATSLPYILSLHFSNTHTHTNIYTHAHMCMYTSPCLKNHYNEEYVQPSEATGIMPNGLMLF